jgi:hypothetical protein
MERRIVVLTPVKNEAWILPLFCATTSLWADHIVIADQHSTDGSREIVSRFPKVTLVDNDSADLDEKCRDTILVNKARELVGTNGIFFRIDADEIFTPNFDSEDWLNIRQSKAGTVWFFPWLQIYPGFASFWEFYPTYGAFVDDGREFVPHGVIHARATFPPMSDDELKITSNISVLHFQFVDWKRMQSKHRYYQCFEHVTFPTKSAIEVFRTYHWMYDSDLPLEAIPSSWIEDYKKIGIDIKDVSFEKEYWWDKKIEEYFAEYSPKYFRHFETYKPGKLLSAKGKNLFDILLMAYLGATKTMYNRKKGILRKCVRKIDHVLQNRFHV